MINVTFPVMVNLEMIRKSDRYYSGWNKLLVSRGGDNSDMSQMFPLSDVIDINGLDGVLQLLPHLPEYDSYWRKLAVVYADSVRHLITDERLMKVLDVAWSYADGLATSDELDEAARYATMAASDPSSTHGSWAVRAATISPAWVISAAESAAVALVRSVLSGWGDQYE
ncbi:MAG: hypothetical protein ACRCT2_04415, partial [Plesiomonas shigelloides]